MFNSTGGPNTDLGTLGGTVSVASAINKVGEIVGSASLNANTPQHATLFSTSGGPNIDLGTLGGRFSGALAINDDGVIAGDSTLTGDLATHATLFNTQGGPLVDLGTLGGVNSYARGINNSGNVVGYSQQGDGSIDGFIWISGVMVSLDSLTDQMSGWDIYEAFDINDNGQIAAFGFNSRGEYHALFLSPFDPDDNGVPEPSSILLTLVALIGSYVGHRRCMQKL